MVFDKVRSISPSRSKHNLYNKHFFDTHIGWFIPVWQYDCAPTTAIKLDFQLMLRSKLIPQEMYGGLKAYLNAFFVPYRILDKRFEDNITGGDGKDVKPYHNTNLAECLLEDTTDNSNAINSCYTYTLHDYLGLPCINPDASDWYSSGHYLAGRYKEDWIEKTINPYDFAAYHKIWNDYCRPEHFVDDDFFDCSEPPSNVNDVKAVTAQHPWCISDWLSVYYGKKFNDSASVQRAYSGVRRVCNNRDYFVSCLPTQQRGVAPTISIQGILPVNFFSLVPDGSATSTVSQDLFVDYNKSASVSPRPDVFAGVDSNGDNAVWKTDLDKKNTTIAAETFGRNAAYGVDMNNSVGFDISEIRVASAIQKWQEIANVCGTRYTEYLRGNYSVAPRDDRLQRAEWIGGAEVDLNTFTTVVTADSATSSAGDDVNRCGGNGHLYLGNYFAPEYGVVMVTMHIKPEITYNRRLDRHFIKESRFDWHNPLFNGIGEDAVRNCEIWNGFYGSKTLTVKGKETFGFIPRNAAMCTAVDYCSGSFCSGGDDSIKTWLRDWSSQPNLNVNFLMCRESEYSAQFGDHVGVPFECCLQSYCDAILPVPADPSAADVAVKY